MCVLRRQITLTFYYSVKWLHSFILLVLKVSMKSVPYSPAISFLILSYNIPMWFRSTATAFAVTSYRQILDLGFIWPKLRWAWLDHVQSSSYRRCHRRARSTGGDKKFRGRDNQLTYAGWRRRIKAGLSQNTEECRTPAQPQFPVPLEGGLLGWVRELVWST